MMKGILALSLALSILPAAALAQATPNPPGPPPSPPSPAQRAAMFKQLAAFGKQARQLHEQMRTQMLQSLTPAHRTAVANIIGQLAVAPSPDPRAAARQLDTLLSQSEQQKIVAAHSTFQSQMKSLHDQMRAQMQAQFPNAGRGHGQGPEIRWGQKHRPTDAGSLLLEALGHPQGEMMMVMRSHVGGPPMNPEGAPPPQP